MKTALGLYIRDMREGDIPQVQGIDREGFPDDWPPPSFKRELQNPGAGYLVVAEANEQEAGAGGVAASDLWWSKVKRLWADRSASSGQASPELVLGFCGLWFVMDEAHLTTIAVKASHRGLGLGEFLLAAALDRAVEKGCRYMTLEARASNLVAQNLYRKYGFTQVGVRQGYYSNNHEDALVMTTENIASASYQSRLQQLKARLAQRPRVPKTERP